jgi:hypothetical protein
MQGDGTKAAPVHLRLEFRHQALADVLALSGRFDSHLKESPTRRAFWVEEDAAHQDAGVESHQVKAFLFKRKPRRLPRMTEGSAEDAPAQLEFGIAERVRYP